MQRTIEELRLRASTVDRIKDRDLLARTYRHHTLKQAARELGLDPKTMRKALQFHGIPIRDRGAKPQARPGGTMSKAALERYVFRAYLRSDRCPPSCPGRESCLNETCILEDLAR